MSDSGTRVDCSEHANTVATFVCRHLREGIGCGFHIGESDGNDPWPDAWCDLCEVTLQREGEWSDSSEPQISLLCTHCYERARARNAYVPAPFGPKKALAAEGDYSELAHGAYERCRRRQDDAKRLWPHFANGQTWHYDAETCTLTFADHADAHVVVADVTITGSFSARTSTWMWAWANPEYSESARKAVAGLRVFGEVRGIDKFEKGHWPADDFDGWDVTQIAADLIGASALYRAPFDHLQVFMLLNNFRNQLR